VKRAVGRTTLLLLLSSSSSSSSSSSLLRAKSKKFTAPKCPLVLLTKVACQKGKALGSEEGKVMGSGLLGVCSRGTKLSTGAEAEFIFLGGQHYDKILVTFEGMRFGENFELLLRKGCMRVGSATRIFNT
jgi:hypothetical protein